MPAHADPRRYRVLFELASGGMGTVYVAERREGAFRRLYALKRLSRVHSDRDAQDMFLDEARLAGMLRHPNVVSVLDFGHDEEGPFLVMDLVEGVSLSALLSAARDSGPLMPLQHVMAVGAQIAEALFAAHELRDEWGESLCVVHRDVTPQNVLVGFDGSVRLTDFGIARAVRRQASTTTGNALKGKVPYMSPEQLRFRQPDARSDIFALGVLLYEMASGQRLYAGEEAAPRILEEPPPNLRAVRSEAPGELRGLVRMMLAKDPADRPQSAREVADVLHRLHAERVTQEGREGLTDYVARLLPSAEAAFKSRLRDAGGPSLPPEPRSTASRRRALFVTALAAVVVLGGVLAWTLEGGPDLEDDPLVSSPEGVAPASAATVDGPPAAPPETDPSSGAAPGGGTGEGEAAASEQTSDRLERETSKAARGRDRALRRSRANRSRRNEGVLDRWPE